MDVFDTDRWKLSLSNYPQGQTVRIAAWLALKPQNIDGDVKLDDPWLAVVPSQYLPVPTVNGMQSFAVMNQCLGCIQIPCFLISITKCF